MPAFNIRSSSATKTCASDGCSIRKQLYHITCDRCKGANSNHWRSTTRLSFTKPGQEFKRKKKWIWNTYKAILISELLLPTSHSMHLAYIVHLYFECIQKSIQIKLYKLFFSQKQYLLCILYIYSSINTSYLHYTRAELFLSRTLN